MKEIYQRFATNTILNSKVDDVYLAILQYKTDYLLQHPEFVDAIYMPKKQVQMIAQAEEELTRAGFSQKQIRKMILECGEANYFGELIKVGDRVFDIYHQTYIDFNQLNVIKYDNLAKYYDDEDYKTEIFKPGECPVVPYEVAAIHLSNWFYFNEYLNSISKEHGKKDISDQFKRELGIGNSRNRK